MIPYYNSKLANDLLNIKCSLIIPTKQISRPIMIDSVKIKNRSIKFSQSQIIQAGCRSAKWMMGLASYRFLIYLLLWPIERDEI